MTDHTNAPIERLRASLADEPERWSPPLRLLAEALLAHCEGTTDDTVSAHDVPPGSVVEAENYQAVLVRLTDGSTWGCVGTTVGQDGWLWGDGGRCRILATGLSTAEARHVASMRSGEARAWCARRAKS